MYAIPQDNSFNTLPTKTIVKVVKLSLSWIEHLNVIPLREEFCVEINFFKNVTITASSIENWPQLP